MSREQSTRRPKCPATGKPCQGSHPLQCFDGAACLRLQQEGRRERHRRKAPVTEADYEALARAEAKRQRRAIRNTAPERIEGGFVK